MILNWFRKKKEDNQEKKDLYITKIEKELSDYYGLDVMVMDYVLTSGGGFAVYFNGLIYFGFTSYTNIEDIIHRIDEEFELNYKQIKDFLHVYNKLYKHKIRDKKLKELGI